MEFALKIITIVSASLLILLILVQQRGATLGAGFGASSELHTTRRGTDKTLHELTIVMAIIFCCFFSSGIASGLIP